ncbi:hypothetical protein SLE2022_331980 [Rubroshorea leprosula]
MPLGEAAEGTYRKLSFCGDWQRITIAVFAAAKVLIMATDKESNGEAPGADECGGAKRLESIIWRSSATSFLCINGNSNATFLLIRSSTSDTVWKWTRFFLPLDWVDLGPMSHVWSRSPVLPA